MPEIDQAWAPRGNCSGPLSDVRVLDLSAFAVGPWAAALLAALGADVIKIDPPYGDNIRDVKPTRAGEPTTYTVCNLGKRSVILNLKDASARGLAYALARESDVVIENSREGVMDRIGMGYQALRRLNPNIIYAASSSFGSDGPLAGLGSTDPHGQAFSGMVSIQGECGGRPEFLRYYAMSDLATSVYLASGVLAALVSRDRTGHGRVIKTSQMESTLALQTTRLAEWFFAGRDPGPLGSMTSAFAPSAAFLCKDRKYLMVSAPDDGTWDRLCEAIGRPDVLADARFADNLRRVTNRDALAGVLEDVFAGGDSAWWRHRLRTFGVPNATEGSIDEVLLEGPPSVLEPLVQVIRHPTAGEMVVPAPPWTFARTGARHECAPTPGEHSSILNRVIAVEHLPEASAASSPDGDDEPLLSGIRVIEIAEGIGGPYAGLLLRQLGADVTKAEPAHGDLSRTWAPRTSEGVSAIYCALNRGKRIVSLDTIDFSIAPQFADAVIFDRSVPLPAGAGREAFVDDLVDQGLVVVVVSSTSTSAERTATELELQATVGLTRYVGSIGAAPVRVGPDVAMTMSGAFSAQAVLAALFERRRSGRGQRVDVSGLSSIFAMMAVQISAMGGPDAWEGFHLAAATSPSDFGVPTADGAISFSAPRRKNAEWEALCHELGADALLSDSRFLSPEQRGPRAKLLNREMGQYTQHLAMDAVLAAVRRNGGLAVPIQNYSEVFAHPQVVAADIVDTFKGGAMLGAPWRIDGVRPHLSAAPRSSFGGQRA